MTLNDPSGEPDGEEAAMALPCQQEQDCVGVFMSVCVITFIVAHYNI